MMTCGNSDIQCSETVLKLISDVTHVRGFVMLSEAEASIPPASVADSSTPLRGVYLERSRKAQNDRAIGHSRGRGKMSFKTVSQRLKAVC